MDKNLCPEGLTGEYCDQEIWVIDYNYEYVVKEVYPIFESFNDAYEYSKDDKDIIAITKDKKNKKYYIVKSGSKLIENKNFKSFTRPLEYIEKNINELGLPFDYNGLMKELGFTVLEEALPYMIKYIKKKLAKKFGKKSC